MKLATRLSAYFLSALAVILICNSVLLFTTARFYLYRQFDEQLQSSLHTLVAAVEVEDDDVKWEPSDHTVTLGSENGAEDIRWVVTNERNKILARSRNLSVNDAEDEAVLGLARGSHESAESFGWRFRKHRLAAPHAKPVQDRSPLEHEALTVLVARRVSDLQSTLNRLAALLIVLPAACWVLAAFAGQWFCQQAIAPVRKMAQSARGIRADDTLTRLPLPSSHDELEELGVAFNNLLGHLFTAYERQRRFTGDAAHQLRTPLTVLQGQVEVSLRRPRSNEEYKTTLQLVDEEVAGLRRTIEALLFLARPNEDQPVPDHQVINLGKLLDSYLQRWKTDARWPDLRSEVDVDLHFHSSPGLLVQLLDILISNAVKYSQTGSPVCIRAKSRGGNLLLEVEDQGIGIAVDDVESIFQPFYRARQARQSGAAGTGLGLAIGARIARVLGGSLQCESQHGAGSRFWCVLPIASAKVTASTVAANTV